MSLILKATGGGPPGRPACDPAEVRRAVYVLFDPEHAVRLQGPNPNYRQLPAADFAAVCKAVEELAHEACVYWHLNPVKLDADKAGVDDHARRRWLLVDVDRSGTKEFSATDEEREAVRGLALDLMEHLDGRGWPCPVQIDSGNGMHLLWRLDLPNDKAATAAVKFCLGVLADLFKGEDRGQVDAGKYDATAGSKMPGTWARNRKAAPDRPHRMARLVYVPKVVEVVPLDLLRDLARQASPELAAELARGLPRDVVHDLLGYHPGKEPSPPRPAPHLNGVPGVGDARREAYVRRTVDNVCGEIAAAPSGQRERTLQRGSARLGQLVGAGDLEEFAAADALYCAACSAGLDTDPNCGERHVRDTIQRNVKWGKENPRGVPESNGRYQAQPKREPPPSADTSDDPLDQDATAEDLIRVNATIRWAWQKWIPVGVLTIIAAEPGCGKTRFCADLARRIYNALPWPDGADPSFPKGTSVLWVPADNQHPELSDLPGKFGFPPSALYLNCTRRNPFTGTMLDEPADLKDFEARILRVKPALVFVDTVFNATDRTAHKPEDAKAFFKPLQEIAARTQSSIVCVSHLNAAGKPLGRRIEGQGRVVVMLEKPDPQQEHRRKLYVRKSFDLYPAPMGVTMGTNGNEYDTNPPQPVEDDQVDRKQQTKLVQARDWLRNQLSHGAKRVSVIRTEAELAAINTRWLYSAKDSINVEEFMSEGKKWWRLASSEPAF